MKQMLGWVMLLMLLLMSAASAEQPAVLAPIVRYEFADASDLGKDSQGVQPLVNIGDVSQGNVSEGIHSAVFSSSNALAAIPLGDHDVTDYLTEFTMTLWGKRLSSQWQDCYMLGSGLPNSGAGLSMGFRAKKEAYMVTVGGIRDENIYLNCRAPKETTRFEQQKSWNLYTLTVKGDTASFAINGEAFEMQGIASRGVTIKDLKHTLTLGGVYTTDHHTFHGGFKGELSDVRIYGCALTAEQLDQLYAMGPGGGNLVVEKPVIAAVQPLDITNLSVVKGTADNQVIDLLSGHAVSFTATDNTVHEDGQVIWTKLEDNEEGMTMAGVVNHPEYANPEQVSITVTIPYGYERTIQLPCIFCDGMVLQRGQDVRIFGVGGAPGDVVTVAFAGQTVQTVCGENEWEAVLAPMEASTENRTMNITYTLQGESKPRQTIIIEDVLVGEVWLGSGQSNMTYAIIEMLNNPGVHPDFYDDYKKIDNWDKLRFFTYPYAEASAPQHNYSRSLAWEKPGSITQAQRISGLAISYASHLQAMLGEDVPVGFVVSAVGGASIEEWLDEATMANLPSYASYMGKQDSRFYNAMIHPIKGYTLRGIVWYQGEANVQWIEDYKAQFAAYRSLYRELFGDRDLPFIVMQLPQFEDNRYPNFREMQWNVMTQDENVHVVCGIDLGDPTNIHPTDKFAFGERAAGVALKAVYGLEPVEGKAYGLSPAITGAKRTEAGILLTVSDAKTLTGPENIVGFQIRVNGQWQDAKAAIREGAIVVDSAGVKPNAIRYLHQPYFTDVAFVYNEYGLPLAPEAALEIME